MKTRATAQPTSHAPAGRAWLRALEPRIMFDAAALATAADAGAEAAKPATRHIDAPDHPAGDASASVAETATRQGGQRQALITPGEVEERLAGARPGREVVFVDGAIVDARQLVDSLEPGVEVVTLDPDGDGLAQIAEYLKGRQGIDAIHIVSHGSLGQITLGNVTLDQAALPARAATLDAIGQSLGEQGDIFLYGCYVGQGRQGQSFVDAFSRLTGADVAASTDMTSGSQRGGDWELEYRSGAVTSTLDLAGAWSDYAGALVSIPSNVTIDFTGEGFVEAADHGSNVFTKGDVKITYSAANWFQDVDDGQGSSPGLFAGAFTGVETVTIETTSGNEFDFVSFFINAFGGGFASVEGFRNGASTGVQTTGTGFGQANGSFTALLNDGIFNNVDRVVITSNAGGFFDVFDSFVLHTVPSNPPSLAATGTNPGFTENGSAVDLFSGITANTNDSGQKFTGATFTVSNVSNGASEILTIGGTDIGLNNGNSGTIPGIGSYSVTVAGATATVTLTGLSRDNSQMGSLIDAITYRNSSDNPGSSSRVITITGIADDGANNNTATPNIASTVTVTPVNDAPTLSPANDTAAYTEGGTAAVLSPSLTVSDADSTTLSSATVTISDFRSGDVLSVGNANGYTVNYNAGTGVLTLTGAGNAAALQTALRSVTYSSTSDDPTFGGTDGTRQINITVTDNGGASSTAATSQVAVTAVNDAPTLSAGPYTWTATTEDATSTAVTVSSLLTSLSAGDLDSASVGVAITASSGNGTWQYSTDGSNWYGVGTVSGNAALLLSASSQLRFVPDGQNGGAPTLGLRAWDQSSGSVTVGSTRSTADASTNGGSTAFSSTAAQANLTVSSVNDAPVLTPIGPTLNGLTDTDVNWVGQAVSSFAGANTNDVDSGAVKGIAITGLNPGNGTWQYSMNGGASWQDIGSVSSSTALLLRSSDRVRFVPDGVNGTNADITYHAWDQSGATSGQQGNKVDASATGGSSPFSSATDTASITVTAVNDAPLVTSSGGSTAFVEGDNVTSTPVAIDGGITISDSDSPLLYGATVQITGNFQSTQDVLAFTGNPAIMGDITGSYDSNTGTLTLTSAGGASAAQWQAALRAVTYSNSSENPVTTDRTISFIVDDGAASSTAANRTVTVTRTNDAPIVTVPGSIPVLEDVASALTGISFSDADAGAGSVTVTLSVPSGTLSAISGGGVTIGGTAAAMTLAGSISDINAFIAGGNVSFQTALNSSTNVTLTASIDDNGLAGGAARNDSDTVALTVTAVNDTPAISAPASINVTEDVPQVLTGISFSDIDAGSGAVSVQFSVAPGSGTLAAGSAAGVTVLGSGTGTLSLTGTLADINAFVAGGAVSFTTANNATGNVVLSLVIDDGGHTGTGGNQTDNTTVTLVVSAENDAPVNNVPGTQTMLQDGVLIFSSGNGNAVAIADVDAGGGTVRVTLTASNGLISLGSTAGLAFSIGSGTGDSTMTFDGSIVDINNALAGLSFAPTAGYHGTASLQITTNDLGLAGNGGNQTDTDLITITVAQPNPAVVSVAGGSPDGGYKVGDTISISVTFDQAVTVSGGTPTLLLETGATDRLASYVSGSGSNTLTFSYTVQPGDLATDLDYQSTAALVLNGATIRNAASNDAFLTLPATGSANALAGQSDLVIDGVAPAVATVTVPANGTYVAGQHLDFIVNFNESITVDTTGGTPRLAVTLDSGGTVYADYLSGSGSGTLTFRLTIASGQLDADGITLGSGIDANGGTLRDAVGNDAGVTLNGVGATTGVRIDAIDPTIASVTVPAAGRYNAGDVLTFTVNLSEPVTVDTGGGTPRLALDLGGTTVYAAYVSGAGTGALQFQYTVQPGDNDGNGIAVTALQANGGLLRDSAGNTASLALQNVGDTSAVLVDTQAPAPVAVARLDATPTNAATISYTVSFSEAVGGVDAADFALSTTGSASGSITAVTQLDATTFRVQIANLAGSGTLRLDLNGTGIADLAGNPLTGGLAGETYTLDRLAPAVTGVAVPANGTYVAGQHLDFTVNFNESITVDTTGGTPRLAVTLDSGGTVYADYLSGSGSGALTFRLTVASGQLDADGITLGSGIDANGGTLRDAVGNDAGVILNGVGATTGVRIDAIDPTIASVTVPAAGRYNAGDVLTFTVNLSEPVTVDTGGGTPRLALDLGGTTVYAAYVSGAGPGALQFQYTVQPGDNDGNGIAVTALQANGGLLRDSAGNTASLALQNVGDTSAVLVDTQAPAPVAVARLDATPTNAATISYTVSFSEAVGGVDAADFALSTSGSASGSITAVTQLDATTFRVQIANLAGSGTLRLDLNGTGIADLAGNPLTGGLAGETYTLDRLAPAVTGVAVPANGTYVAGQHLDFTVNFNESITVDTTGGTPRLAVTLDSGGTVYADYLSGSGSGALTFRLTVASGQLDADGITLGSGIDANGGTLRDATGNAAQPTLAGLPVTDGIRIDAQAPQAQITLADPNPIRSGTVHFTVTFSEVVSGVDRADFALLAGGNASGTITSVTQVDARTYSVQVDGVGGNGTLALALSAQGSGIADGVGNPLSDSAISPAYNVRPNTLPVPAPVPAPVTPPSGPSTPIVITPVAPPVTLSPTDPVAPVDAPTLTLGGDGSAAGSGIAALLNPLSADPLAPGGNSTFAPVEVRASFIELGVGSGAGLQAMPDIGDYAAQAGQPISIGLPISTFTHSEKNVEITLEVRLADGRPLPNWLKFDPVTGSLSGTPPKGLNQKLVIEVIARDSKGNRATSHLDLMVRSTEPRAEAVDMAPLRAAFALPAAERDVAQGKPALAQQFDQFGRPARQAAGDALLRHLQLSRAQETV
ncbi:DUF4347 domain-containing protein [Chitiniphilus purpureus]|uniref:DUF4347 domain-containing protein n=1 Tax=Chitiniphilus purpureus TaxID=2981137 RepID=A0ABY6DM66_9NEIS|nr:DUF4347 domain-containing protein [Chitiniphilus sp. CD1]UXY15303.1 DUF4347 domain-containing protein [Chitiniphilus sp. CD1]